MSLKLLFLTAVLTQCFFAFAQKYRFTDIAQMPETGLAYRRAVSRTNAGFIRVLENSLNEPFPVELADDLPMSSFGQPGVAVGDFNEDGYDDIYVTNGPGRANSLFINQFPVTGKVQFRDEAKRAGVAARNQDSTGVCYGDLNNDGHLDIVVVSEFNRNQIFLSNGDGTYRRLPWVRATGDTELYPSAGCTLGDVNNDGWLDIVVANAVDRDTSQGCLNIPFDLNGPDQLFINNGPDEDGVLTFKDTTFTSGINDHGGSIPPGRYTITWTAVLLDVNLDGNLDLVVANDQCSLPTVAQDPENGTDRGAVRVLIGDGTGQFVSSALQPRDPALNNRNPGGEGWMGLGFGDFNCDGVVDIFSNNAGDYHAAKLEQVGEGAPRGVPGRYSSRWWLGSGDGDYVDASLEEHGITVFGWGNIVFDYDNDGDQDIATGGSLDLSAFAGSSNPNALYKNNNCKAQFDFDHEALEPTGMLRNYQGMAMGDFNLDGYPDVVGVSGFRTRKENLSMIFNYSSPFDETAYFTDLLVPGEGGLVWTGNVVDEGDMMLQMNRETDPSKCWVSVQPVGMRGVIRGANVNRGALGSTLMVTPKGMKTVSAPIAAGESYGSQHSPRRNFGLGSACTGTVEIVWGQSGVRNRLYDVTNREVLTLPEIPCSYDGKFRSETRYRLCVRKAVKGLFKAGIVDKSFQRKLFKSAMRARRDYLKGRM